MKKNITFFLLPLFILSFSCYSYGQASNKYMGVIKVKDTLIMTYKLEFKVIGNVVSGYSLTDFGGEHETKSKIFGHYDAQKKLLSFGEVELIYTKSTFSEHDFCNIYLEPSKFKLGGTKLFGEFKGKFNDGTQCLNGEIAMNSVEKIDKRVTKFTKKIEKSKRVPDSIKQKLRNTKLIDTLNLNILKKDEITTIPTKASTIKCIIYDGGQIDNDIITLYNDGKKILSNYTISKTKKVISIPITKKLTKISAVANSEGSIGSCTVVIEIHDGNQVIKTMTNLKKNDKTVVNFVKK